MSSPAFILSCDAKGCTGVHASQKCSKCKTKYYCNADCQRKDWKQHNQECAAFVKHSANLEATRAKMLAVAKKSEEAVGEECCICLEKMDDISNILQLQCQHIVCVECMFDMFKTNSSARTKCPLCRDETTKDMPNQLYANSAHFLNVARKYPEGSDLRKHFCELSQNELKKMDADRIELENLQSESQQWVDYVVFTKAVFAQLEFVRGNFVVSIELIDALLEAAGSKCLEVSKIELLEHKLLCFIKLQEYVKANGIVRELAGILRIEHVKSSRELYYRASEVLFYLGEYEGSISFAKGAIEMNRSYDDVYKYIVLSYLAINDLDSACVYQHQAYRYETPWDLTRVEENKKYLASLEAMRGRGEDSSAEEQQIDQEGAL